MRAFFVIVPALIPASVSGLITGTFVGAGVAFVAWCVLGYVVTEPRPERGEYR